MMTSPDDDDMTHCQLPGTGGPFPCSLPRSVYTSISYLSHTHTTAKMVGGRPRLLPARSCRLCATLTAVTETSQLTDTLICFSVSSRFVFAFRMLQGDDEDVQALVVDNGSGMCKAGASGAHSPHPPSRLLLYFSPNRSTGHTDSPAIRVVI